MISRELFRITNDAFSGKVLPVSILDGYKYSPEEISYVPLDNDFLVIAERKGVVPKLWATEKPANALG